MMLTPFQDHGFRFPHRIHKLIKQYFCGTFVCMMLLMGFPLETSAEVQKYNVVTDEFYGLNAERILLVSTADDADKKVFVTGKCKSRAATEIYLENDTINAREKWFILSDKDNIEPDMHICLTGNLPAWFEKVAITHRNP